MSRYFAKGQVPTWNDLAAYSDRWALYKELVGAIPPDVGVRGIVLAASMAYVDAESGLGVAMVVHGGAGMPRLNVDPAKTTLRDLAALSASWSFEEATVGVAALNAWYATEARMREAGAAIDGGDNDAFRSYRDIVAGKRVCVVGHFPMIERMGDICDLTVLERNPQSGDIPDSACEFIIPEQDILFSTGITLQNKTLPRLLELARLGGVQVVLVGPSVVPAPVLFDWGVDCLAGSVVLDTDTGDMRRAIEQGCHMSAFSHGLTKMRLERPGWE